MELEKCCQEKCDEIAAVRVFWPGDKPKIMCIPHAAQAQNIGKAMGCYIYVEPYGGRDG